VSATEVYNLFEREIIRNNGLTADSEFLEAGLKDKNGNVIVVGRSITNYIRAGIYLKTERDFSTAHQLVERYRMLIEDMELGLTNRQLIAKTIPKLEDFIIMPREHR